MKLAVCFAILLAVHIAHAADLNPDVLKKIDSAVSQSIQKKETPGGVLWIEHDGAIYCKEYGLRAIVPAEEPATRDTIYDAASLTKVIATAPAIVLLHERGKLDIEKPIAAYIPGFAKNGKEAITLRHLLTHTSGLRPGLGLATPWSGHEEALTLACDEKLQHPPGKIFVYSDINFIVLGEIVRAVSGEGLDTFTQRELYAPLKMTDTGFLPADDKLQRIAPTEKQSDDFGVRGEKNGAWLRGAVHDPTARRMQGVAGHAGVFTTASDLARFARMLLNKGELDGVRVLKTESVALLTTVQAQAAVPDRDDAPAVSRALGFDMVSPYDGPRGTLYPKTSFGHTGWTGTSLWIDPTSKSFVIFLANRNHPDGKGDLRALRRTLGTFAAEATK